MSILNKTFWRGAFALSVTAIFATVYGGSYGNGGLRDNFVLTEPLAEQDTTRKQGDTSKLPFPIKSDPNDPYNKVKNNTLDLKNPTAIDRKVELDSSLQYYKITNKVGNEQIGEEQFVPFEQYLEEDNRQWMQDYFKRRSLSQSNVITKSIIPKIPLGDGLLDNVFGGAVDIRPTGSAELIFAGDFNRIENPSWSIREQRSSQFKFDQKIQVNVIGNIADRIKLGINYDTQSSFDFENQRKLNYVGKDDEIFKSIELGDVSMPVPNSLISGSQSLFGVKTQLQFGKLFVTGVYSQQRGERKEINVEGGAQRTQFNITADNYDANRHFFLSHFFRNNYNAYNLNYPSLSNVQITRVEVWVTNPQQQVQNTRNILAFMDLGEKNPYNSRPGNPNPLINAASGPEVPDNRSNNLYSIITGNTAIRNIKTATAALDQYKSQGFFESQDYQRIDNARQLAQTEFTYHPRLGFISINQSLNGAEVLAVAYEYTINGQKFQVGEFARDVPTDPGNPNVIFLKMLKSVSTRPDLPIWDLMMKNIYSLNAYQVQPTDFRLQVVYEDNRSGSYLNYIPSPEEPINGVPLVRVLGLDRFNTLGEPKADGNFDYLEGVTINSANGRIIFPVLEPFGEDLRKKFNDPVRANYFTYDSLYSSTRAVAIQQTSKNKFYLRGHYQGASGTDISLNAINVPPGSVKVFAGGQELRENADYTVDYAIGRVKIINQSIINSGSVIKVQLESNSLFSIQQKTLMGTRAEYRFNKDFNLGATMMYLRERPLTPKVNLGDEPIRNAIWGLDGNYSTDSRFLTKLIDNIPLIETKEKSTVSLKGEFAQILPGHPEVLNDPEDANKGGVSYLDDFEGSEVPLPMVRFSDWHLASTPGGEGTKFPESALNDNLSYNFNRAKIAWYNIDPLFFRNNSLTPNHIKADLAMQSNHYMREVLETEVFPSKQLPNGIPGTLSTLDLAYYPNERGQYNYNFDELTVDGKLSSPEKRWAGIMRRIETTDFEAANIEYMEFWLMDPFIYKPAAAGGEMYINIGNVSEDVLKDGRKLWENGLPKTDVADGVDNTNWGRVPNGLQITNAFDNEADARKYQDIGYDGLGPVGSDDDEREFYRTSYLDPLANKFGAQSQAFQNAANDPSGDNFRFYTGDEYDQASANVLQRYMSYNNPQGNTPVSSGTNTVYGTTVPDDEDINRDFTLNTTEEFFEYRIKLDPQSLTKDKIGQNYLADVQDRPAALKNGKTETVRWYQFKIPVRNYDRKVGPIQDFRSIRFMRLYLTGFQDTVICRFAQLQLVRAEWRSYLYSLKNPGEHIPQDPNNTTFTVSTVNLEENGKRKPPYVLPPGIQRVVDPTTPDLIQQNEQSLSLKVCNLEDGDARAVFKNTTSDIRQYKRLRMFVHAEGETLQNEQMSIFVRIGNDLNNNYYEFEKKLIKTDRNTLNKDEIWPRQNFIDLLLEELYNAKQARNVSGGSQLVPFIKEVNGGKITILGNPDLGHIRSMLIGIRNPKDDGQPICGEVWVNELRVTEFDERTGWAANVMARAKLADFGLLTVSGTRRTVGFGGIEQSLQQRSQQDTRGYDVSTALELGKFFPQRFNIKVPMYYSYSELIHRPRYNPLSPDLPLETLIQSYENRPVMQDSVRQANEDFTGRTSLNFTNVQKLRGPDQKKTHIYDIENFYVTFAYAEIFRRNIERVYDIDQNYKTILGYGYNFTPKTIQPFKKLGSNKYLQLISDFNLYYLPQSMAFTIQGDRRFSEILYRNTDDVKTIIVPQFDKLFKIGRTYDLRYNFSKSLRFSYSAGANSRIPEPYGRIDTDEKRDSLRASILSLGVLNDFSQNTNASYDVPISKLPFMDWTSLQLTYAGTYTWLVAPLAQPTLGNTISNSQTLGANTQLNMTSLYSKSTFLRNILQNRSQLDEVKKQRQENKDKNKPVKGKTRRPTRDTVQTAGVGSLAIAEGAARILMSLRSVSGTYTQTDGTILPGFRPTPKYIGLDPSAGNAPGLPFVLGLQPDKQTFQNDIIRNHWLSEDTNLTALYITRHNISYNGQAVLEPIKGMRINVDFFKKTDETNQENFRYGNFAGVFAPTVLTPLSTGSYSISYISILTAFKKDIGEDLSPVFQQFENNRQIVAGRLASDPKYNPIANVTDTVTGLPLGFTKTNQDVLVSSFLAAYSGRDPSKVSLNPFPSVPLPNWRLNYTGLSNIPFIQQFTKNVNINHGYRSTYTVGNYISTIGRDLNVQPGKNLEPEKRIDNITISEDFSPLIGFDISWVNNWTTKIEYKKQRVLSFAFSNYQLSEVRSEEFVIGAGYRTNKLRLPFKINRKVTYLENDFSFRLDLSIRDNKSIIRILDEQKAQSSAGQKVISIRPTIDYVLSKSLVLRLFYTHNITEPHISTQYPTSQVNFGFSLRYTLTP